MTDIERQAERFMDLVKSWGPLEEEMFQATLQDLMDEYDFLNRYWRWQ